MLSRFVKVYSLSSGVESSLFESVAVPESRRRDLDWPNGRKVIVKKLSSHATVSIPFQRTLPLLLSLCVTCESSEC